MDFINFEADDWNLNFEDDDEQILTPQNDNFIDDDSGQEKDESPSFYKFVNKTRDLDEALNNDDQSHLDRCDLRPEMVLAESKENVQLDEFNEADKCSNKFKETICNFQDGDVKDSFFDAVFFGLLFKSSDGKDITREPVDEISGKEFVAKLFNDKESVQFGDSFESFIWQVSRDQWFSRRKGVFFESVLKTEKV